MLCVCVCGVRVERGGSWGGEERVNGSVWCEGEEWLCPRVRVEEKGGMGVEGEYEVSGSELWGVDEERGEVRRIEEGGETWEESVYNPVNFGVDGELMVVSEWGPGSELLNMETLTLNSVWKGATYPSGSDIEGEVLCTGGTDQSYQLLNVSDWLNPEEKGSWSLLGNAIRMRLQGAYLWMLEEGVGVELYEISNLSKPQLISNYLLTNAEVSDLCLLQVGTRMSADGRSEWIYISTKDQGIYEIDYQDMWTPRKNRHWSEFNASSVYIGGQIMSYVDGEEVVFYDLIHDQRVSSYMDNGTHVTGAGAMIYTMGEGQLRRYDMSSWSWNLTFDQNRSGTYLISLQIQEVQKDHHVTLNQTTKEISFEVIDSGYPEIGQRLDQQPSCCQVSLGMWYNFTYDMESFKNCYNESMTYQLVAGPLWITFDELLGRLSGMPTQLGEIGSWNVSLKVTNPRCDHDQPNASLIETWTMNVTGSLSVLMPKSPIIYDRKGETALPAMTVLTPSPWIRVEMELNRAEGTLNWTEVGGTTIESYELMWNVSGPTD